MRLVPRVVVLLLSASSVFAVSACGDDADDTGSGDASIDAGHAPTGSGSDAATPRAGAGGDDQPIDAGSDVEAGPGDGGEDAAAEAEDDAGTDSDAAPPTLSRIEVAPRNPRVELDLDESGERAFTATAHYRDGTTEDVTDQVEWSVGNSKVGAFDDSTLEIPAFDSTQAEVSDITAQLSGVEGVAQITVVAYASSGPARERLLVLPYEDPDGATNTPLDFATAIPSLDVFLLMDATGSMGGEITNLSNSIATTIIPAISAAVTDSQFGVGALEDFPVSPYGSLHGSDCGGGGEAAEDQPFKLRQAITSDATANQTAVNGLSTGTAPIGCGNDWPEAGLEALYQVATGEGLSGPAPTSVPANHTGIGGVGFREGAMPVVVTISDASTHGVGEAGTCTTFTSTNAYEGTVADVAHSRAQVKDALAAICARSVAVASLQPALDASCSPIPYMTDLSTSTGARVPPAAWDTGSRPAGCAANQCCTGLNGAGVAADGEGLCPLVFQVDANGTGLGTTLATSIEKLTAFASFDAAAEPQGASTDVDGDPLPDAHTTADFIQALTPTGFTLPDDLPVLPDPTFDTTGFFEVTPGTTLAFEVQALNDFIPQAEDAQLFRVSLLVVADGCSPLDTQELLVLVPPLPVK